MKFVQINKNDDMCEHDKQFTSKNIRKIMRELSGVKKINLLYSYYVYL